MAVTLVKYIPQVRGHQRLTRLLKSDVFEYAVLPLSYLTHQRSPLGAFRAEAVDVVRSS
jgi:hypothetical protein